MIQERQRNINSTYKRLNKMAQQRHRCLDDSIQLHRFYRECDEFEAWAKEIDKHLKEKPNREHVEAFRKKFDVCLTLISMCDRKSSEYCVPIHPKMFIF